VSSAIWYLGKGDTGPILSGTLERETAPGTGVFVAENLTGCQVTLSLFKANSPTTYKSGAAVTIVSAVDGKVSYAWAAADSQQGLLTGKFCVTYPDTTKVSFPNDGPFQIRVSR
jgi:hypothetical protein